MQLNTNQIMRVGIRGCNVESLQNALNVLLENDMEVDGIYGQKTRNAVIAAQKLFGLDADGVAGSETLGALKNELEKK